MLPAENVTLPVLRIWVVVVPGARVAPDLTVREPILPAPPSVPPLTTVPPVYVFWAETIRLPAPTSVNLPTPLMIPPSVSDCPAPTLTLLVAAGVMILPDQVLLPLGLASVPARLSVLPKSRPAPSICNVPAGATVTDALLPSADGVCTSRMPALTLVIPV